MIFSITDDDTTFPPPNLAEDDGLLAVGGNLSTERLLLAYRMGIFPWYSEETPVLWYSPHERFVLFPEKIKISKSMKHTLKSGVFTITEDTAFPEVIKACAMAERKGQDGTWITGEMQKAYIRLHEMGHAHSIEAWKDGKLAGGLYGIGMNAVFCGESMFSHVSNASKAALIWLCQNKKYRLIDCQVYSEHLAGMGAGLISREEYTTYLV